MLTPEQCSLLENDVVFKFWDMFCVRFKNVIQGYLQLSVDMTFKTSTPSDVYIDYCLLVRVTCQ